MRVRIEIKGKSARGHSMEFVKIKPRRQWGPPRTRISVVCLCGKALVVNRQRGAVARCELATTKSSRRAAFPAATF
jgi:hypothetical protein